ncbi:Phosphatidylinositol-4-phosphate 5-kinase family protein [Euphorbia peplus]|nr:Phosphatidylinositol-4-phosphate 5-kinase family protein [Euphorbia peplus]
MDKTTLLRENISLDTFENVRTRCIQYNLDENNNLGTANNNVTELEWKDYCPGAFRNIQELDDISPVDYSMLVCSHDILKEVTLPGKAGRTFFLSHDIRLGVKTLRKIEFKAILDMFRSYYFYLSKNPTTLLLRLYGLHSVRQYAGIKVYFIVFGNVAQPEVSSAECYYLKGISTGRRNNKVKFDDFILHKDFDFGYRFYLNITIREKLLKQIKLDCAYLEEEGRMDYCLALVIAFPTTFEGN